MGTRNEYNPIVPVLPGRIIKNEIEERGISQKELAAMLDMTGSNLSALISGKRPVTTKIAVKIETALGVNAQTLVNLQSIYDCTIERAKQQNEQDQIACNVEQRFGELLNLKELYKRLRIFCASASDRLKDLESFFGMTIETVYRNACSCHGCFKRSDKLRVDQRNLTTWVALAHRKAQDQVVMGYKQGDAEQAAKEIALATHNGKIAERLIINILNSNHIGYIHLEKLDKVPVDGYSTFLQANPVIVVTHRYNDIHKLVFSILHELGHIHSHDGKSEKSFVAIEDVYSTEDPEEQRANEFARDILIPPAIWAKIQSCKPSNIRPAALLQAIYRSAKANGIHPKIAVYRYQYTTKMYNLPTGKAQKIR